MATTTSAGAAPLPPPQGNEFTFYIPNPPVPSAGGGGVAPTGAAPTAAAAKSAAKPVPKLTTPASGGKATFARPAEFIQANYVVTATASFGAGQCLGGTHRVVRKVDVIRAALEGGYGRRLNWTSDLVLSSAEADELAAYLIQRLQMVDAFVETDVNRAKTVLPFFERVEASEKTAASFILGGMGAFLAAQQWLTAGGDRVRSFLHVGTFTKGIAGKSPMVALAPSPKKAGKKTSSKVPDFLVEGESGQWHVFESKGGHFHGRWTRLCEGLAQLAHVPPIGWAGKPHAAAETCVAVHTSVDAGKALRIVAVDPPPIRRRTKPGGDGEQHPLKLVEGVCRLLKMLEALEQYRALSSRGDEQAQKGEWTFTNGAAFGGLRIGVPARYFEREEEVRYRIAVFFAVRDVVKRGKPKNFERFRSSVEAKFPRGALEAFVDEAWGFSLFEMLKRLNGHIGSADFLYRCSLELGLESLASELLPPNGESIDGTFMQLVEGGEYAVTSGGLFLQATPVKVVLGD